MYVSDHAVVLCETLLKRDDVTRKQITYRIMDNVNYGHLADDVVLDPMLDDFDLVVENFHCSLKEAFNKHTPAHTKSVSLRRKVPWFTDDVRDAKRQMRRWERIWHKYKSEELWTAFCVARSHYKRMLYSAKRDVISSKVMDCGKDTQKLYALVNNLLGTRKENSLPSRDSPEELAENFANFFFEKVEKIWQELSSYSKYVQLERETPEFNFVPMTKKEVLSIIRGMPAKYCDLDPIPSQVFKDLALYLAKELTELVNVSLMHGVYAKEWKLAIVKPLLKKTGMDIYDNSASRPLSNLIFLAKIIEKCLLSQFTPHCTMFGLLPAYQSAYHKYHSCETSLLNLTDTILWNMEKQWVTSCSVIDLSATFDLVDHSIILDVLSKQYGVSDSALKWFDSYLRPQGFKVNVDGHYSSYKEIFSSAPQGSCSGPQLYSVYASTMRYVLNNHWPFDLVPPQGREGSIELNGFTDDHLLNKGFNPSVRSAELFTKQVMEHSLSEIDNWMHQHHLKMNSQKTEFIYLGSKRQLSKCEMDDIIVCGNIVTRVSAIKLLGMDLDSQLSFKSHIVKKSRMAMFSLLKIKHIRKYLTVQACEVLVHGLVMSHLHYGSSLFFGLPDCDINKLQRVQNAAAKWYSRGEEWTARPSALWRCTSCPFVPVLSIRFSHWSTIVFMV